MTVRFWKILIALAGAVRPMNFRIHTEWRTAVECERVRRVPQFKVWDTPASTHNVCMKTHSTARYRTTSLNIYAHPQSVRKYPHGTVTVIMV